MASDHGERLVPGDRLVVGGSGAQHHRLGDPALAVETLEKHAENNRDAMMCLVEFYSDGIVANRRKAEYWKEKLDRYDELMRKSIDADGAGK